MLGQPLSVERVLGNGPFAEIGAPSSVALSGQLGLIAVGGAIGWPRAGSATGGWRAHRIGIYRRNDLTCRHLVESVWPVNALAFHPSLPLLAVGTGSYDGGFSFKGELLLIHLDSGTTVSALDRPREVRDLVWRHWREGRVLDIALAPSNDWELGPDALTVGFDAMIERDDWSTVAPKGIDTAELDGPLRENQPPRTKEDARKALRRVAAAAGAVWSPRRMVQAVEQLQDGRVLAALDAVRLESWRQDGALQWRVLEEGGDGGRLIHVASDQRTAWVSVPGRRAWQGPRRSQSPDAVVRHSLADGKLVVPSAPASTRRPRSAVLRALWNAQPGADETQTADHAPSPEGNVSDRMPFGAFDPTIILSFPIRHASAFYFLHHVASESGLPPQSASQAWVATAENGENGRPPPVVRRLFPFSWFPPPAPLPRLIGDTEQSRPLLGGPGTEVADATGQALVHSATLHDPVRAFIVRRHLPDGFPTWVFTTDSVVIALEWDGHATVYASLRSGEIVALDAMTGRTRWRHRPTVAGMPVVGLSLASSGPGQLVIGTADGRILLCTTDQLVTCTASPGG